jgi:hypothetical protein
MKRGTFAYACEAYSCVLQQTKNSAERRTLAEDYGRAERISEECVDTAEIASIVRAASAARNGWKVIARCAPVRRSRSRLKKIKSRQ